jgi:hypothetical protein
LPRSPGLCAYCRHAGDVMTPRARNSEPASRKPGRPRQHRAIHAPGNRPARWTETKASGRGDSNDGSVCLAEGTFHNRLGRHQTDSPPRRAPHESQTASKVSQGYF